MHNGEQPKISTLAEFLRAVGRWGVDSVRETWEVCVLCAQCLWLALTRGFRYRGEIVRQLYFVGVASLPVVITTGIFAGAVFAYAMYNQLVILGVASWAGAIMAKMLTWHLGPVLIGLVLAGRTGCSMTAELGTMNVTEQVDALRSFGVSPAEYLVMPRVLASMLMGPVLTAFAIFVGLLAGMFMIIFILGGDSHYQWVQIQAMMIPYDYVQGLIKGTVFGVLIALVCCRNGLATRGGAEGVGLATTRANVSACIGILVVNLFVSMLLVRCEPYWNRLLNYLA